MADTDGTPLTGAGDDPLWDDWETPLHAPSVPLLHLDGFDGPMDLLLDLAERQRIDLGQVSILALAEQFVAELEGRLRATLIERRADWLIVAARLLLLRSRLLFPATPEAAADAAREAALEVQRIEETRLVRAAAAWLEARPLLGRDVFARPQTRDPQVASYRALMEACLTVLRGREGGLDAASENYRVAVVDLWRLGDALARMRQLLARHPAGGELGAFLPRFADTPHRLRKERTAVASTLLAALELAKAGEGRLDQEVAFGPVRLRAAGTAAASTGPAET
jgi:segregation and condensation protein A